MKLEKGKITFKNYFKQIPAPFKIFANFEWITKSVENNESSRSKKYQDHIPCSFSYKAVCVDDKFGKPIAVSRGENAAYKNLLKQFLKNMNTIKK